MFPIHPLELTGVEYPGGRMETPCRSLALISASEKGNLVPAPTISRSGPGACLLCDTGQVPFFSLGICVSLSGKRELGSMNVCVPFSCNTGARRVTTQAQQNLPQRTAVIVTGNTGYVPFVDRLSELSHQPCEVVLLLFPFYR